MALLDDVRKISGIADRLQGPVGNEANTKALLIEPMLSALGWDTTNLDHVLRDWPLRDNSTIDYALRMGDENVMLLEARGVSESLDDQGFAGRAVNSSHAEGVLWCVLTNGLVYRVYRTDEEIPLDEKLAFEVDLRKAAVGSPADTANVPLLSRDSVADGSLALYGEQKVFTDPRVRAVLAQLAASPSDAFIDAINQAIGEHKVSRERMRASLGRVLVVETTPVAPRPSTVRAPEPPPAPPEPPRAAPEPPTAAPEPPRAAAEPPPVRVRETPPEPPPAPPVAEPTASVEAPAPPSAPPPAEPAARSEVEVADSFEAVATPEIKAEPREEAPTTEAAPAAPESPASTESAGALETARRRFLGGVRTPKDSGGSGGESGGKTDPYAPLSRPEGGPFDDAGF
jgi:outer membrane biosynthesis protein TonB